MELATDLILYLLNGFAIFVLATSFVRWKNSERKILIDSLTDSASVITSAAATGYLLTWLWSLYDGLHSEEMHDALMARIAGPYWYGYWIYPFCYGLIPQLLWGKRMRQLKTLRLIIAFLLLFVHYLERMIIMITSLHRDYIPFSRTMFPGSAIVEEWLTGIVIFSLVLGLVHFTRERLMKGRLS
jgi:molybdopterin-containing oxidoreductase family membrane subunit